MQVPVSAFKILQVLRVTGFQVSGVTSTFQIIQIFPTTFDMFQYGKAKSASFQITNRL